MDYVSSYKLCKQFGHRFNIKTIFPGITISIIKIRRLWDHLFCIMGIRILVERHLYIESVPVNSASTAKHNKLAITNYRWMTNTWNVQHQTITQYIVNQNKRSNDQLHLHSWLLKRINSFAYWWIHASENCFMINLKICLIANLAPSYCIN